MAKSKKTRSAKDTSKPAANSPFFRPFSGLKDAVVTRAPTSPAPHKPEKRPEPTPSVQSPSDDMTTFERFMAGVTPMEAHVQRVPSSMDRVEDSTADRVRQIQAAQQAADQVAREQLHALVNEGRLFEIVDDGHRIEGRRRGVDAGFVRKLRLGQFPLDATLDLHGMKVEQAREAVAAFIRTRRQSGDRAVAIIHGRGKGGLGHSVLRGELAAWLGEGEASSHTSAFMTAHEEQGGDGTMVVLLTHPSVRFHTS